LICKARAWHNFSRILLKLFMDNQNPPKKNGQVGTKNDRPPSPGNSKTVMNPQDSTEDQHGKGGSARKSNKETEDQDANQEGFGEDE
jgi:hypothetical protein